MALPATFVNAVAITPSDSTVYSPTLKGLYVGGTGAVAVKTVGGQTVTFAGVPAGATLFVEVQQVLATGTAATSIVGLR